MSYRIAQGCFLAFLLILGLSQCGCSGSSGPTAPSIQPEGVLSPNGLFVVSGQVSERSGAVVEARWQILTKCIGQSASIAAIPVHFDPYSLNAAGAASISSEWGQVGGFYTDLRHGGPDVHVIGADEWNPSFDHELLHLWLDRTYNDADGEHTSSLWGRCV